MTPGVRALQLASMARTEAHLHADDQAVLGELAPVAALAGNAVTVHVEELIHHRPSLGVEVQVARSQMAIHTNTVFGKILSSNKQWRKYEKDILLKADKIITVVEEMKERLVKLGIVPNKIFIVSNTLKIDSFQVPDKKPDPNYFTLFYAGGLNYHRGLQVVIKALPKIIKKIPNIRFWIIGKGSYQKELEKLVEKLELQQSVKFRGWKNQTEIADLLVQSDIALIPHLKYEHTDSTIPHKLFQNMYAKKPVIASNCNPIKRIINKSKCGLVYENENRLTECLLKFHNHPEIRKGMGGNGKKVIMEKYNWKETEKKLLELYRT